MKNKINCLFLSIVLLSILCTPSIPSYAAIRNHAGGQVTVSGKITFEEKDSTPKIVPDDSDSITSSGKNILKKYLPNTGEKIAIIYVVFGCLLLSMLIFFVTKKRRQGDER